jgi:hypothetical protein
VLPVRGESDVGLGHERRHAVAAEFLGIDDAVGAGAFQLGLGRLVTGAGDDLELGAQRPARHGQVEVVRVGVDRRHQGSRPLDPGPEERLVVGDVTADRCVGHRVEPIGVAVHDDEVPMGAVEELRHLAPDPPPAAHDHVPVHPGDVPFHSSPPDEVPHVALDENFEYCREREQRGPDADEDHDDREHLAAGVEGVG